MTQYELAKFEFDDAPCSLPSRIVAVRMGDDDLLFLDRWISKQPGSKPSRAEAVRQLVAEALARK